MKTKCISAGLVFAALFLHAGKNKYNDDDDKIYSEMMKFPIFFFNRRKKKNLSRVLIFNYLTEWLPKVRITRVVFSADLKSLRELFQVAGKRFRKCKPCYKMLTLLLSFLPLIKRLEINKR